MNVRTITAIAFLVVAAALAGCAGKTTDPRQGGLFSYNPKAYEERLAERKQNLSRIEQATEEEKAKSSQLEMEKSAREQEKADLEAEFQKLATSTAALEKDIRNTRAGTAARKKEQGRILGEIEALKAASKLADEMEDPEEQQLELERLQKRRDALEKEAAKLMLL